MKEAYSYEPPVMALDGCLNAQLLIPPEHKTLAGRPRKRKSRYQAKEEAHKRRKTTCQACGTPGHHASTCTKPSTKHRMDLHGTKAMEWAKQQSGMTIGDYDSFVDK